MAVQSIVRLPRVILRCLAILMVFVVWWYCIFAGTGTPSNDTASKRALLETESARVYDGLQLSIAELRWMGAELEVCFALSFEGDLSGRSWGFEHPWFTLLIRFWDVGRLAIDGDKIVTCNHDMEFIRERTRRETVRFLIDVPKEARFLGVQFGNRRCVTNKVRIPGMARWHDILFEREWRDRGR
jgi:hypothetical protein